MNGVAIVRMGLCTPLGVTATATLAAIAGGLTAFADTEIADHAEQRIRAARLSHIDRDALREERMISLAVPALRECLADLDPRRGAAVRCYLALPEPRRAPLDVDCVVRRLRDAAPSHLGIDWSSRPVMTGRAAFFTLLEHARKDLEDPKNPLALIGGVDSLCDKASLRELAAAGRTLGVLNPDGIIPGEAAGFALLAGHGLGGRGRPLGRIVAHASARDLRRFDQRNPMIASALTEVFGRLRGALAAQPRPQKLHSCQTGEAFWARELNNAYLRNAAVMPEPFRTSLVAECMGDVGAAAPFVSLAMALGAFATSWRSGIPVDRVIMYGASDEGSVGGCVVAA